MTDAAAWKLGVEWAKHIGIDSLRIVRVWPCCRELSDFLLHHVIPRLQQNQQFFVTLKSSCFELFKRGSKSLFRTISIKTENCMTKTKL